jgi:hypothetical protein
MADSKMGEHLDGIVFLCGESPQISEAKHGHSGPGWYAHNEEYPEEGALFIGRTEDDLARMLEAAIAEISRARNGRAP